MALSLSGGCHGMVGLVILSQRGGCVRYSLKIPGPERIGVGATGFAVLGLRDGSVGVVGIGVLYIRGSSVEAVGVAVL